ncbi:MAG: DUF1972 domain-containing protein [Muribaculaceae bacterium]|nr:DUF1972 domain-containing protein [Muribaculaceae bacterium]
MKSHYRYNKNKNNSDLAPIRVGIIGTVGVPACYGGFETLAEQLVLLGKRKIDNRRIEYSVYCSSRSYPIKLDSFHGAKLHYTPLKANGLQSIPYDIISLIKAARKCDVLLMLGVSGCVFLPVFRLFCKKRLIINIDGLEHRRQKWSKWVKKFLKFSEKCAVKYADTIIADNIGIVDYVTSEYHHPSTLIPYGGDQALINVPFSRQKDILDNYNIEKGNYAFGLCRIEPENNVEMILEAFSRISDKEILFVGNWNNSEYGRTLRQKYSKYPNIHLHDAIYDLTIVNTLRNNCKIYLHGHSAGGTNPSLVEAMFFGVPILAYDVNYNRYSTLDKAIYFNSSRQLETIINDLNDDLLKQCGNNMKSIARNKYLWKNIARQYESLYIAP